MFDHDSPQVVKKLLTPESINGDVHLQFVNHKGEYDRLIARVTKGANVSGRAHVIYQWLSHQQFGRQCEESPCLYCFVICTRVFNMKSR